jgi:hypothetical protein
MEVLVGYFEPGAAVPSGAFVRVGRPSFHAENVLDANADFVASALS